MAKEKLELNYFGSRNLESGAGRGDLANNHFESNVMKVERESVKHDDDSDQECFRKYNNPSESFKDHALFLRRPRYSKLFDFSKAIIRFGPKGCELQVMLDPRYPTN
jgi:hypothetical protein